MRYIRTNILILLILAIFLMFGKVYSQIDEKKVLSELPELLGASNQGNEFYLAFIPCLDYREGSNAIRVFVTSLYETRVTLEIPTHSFVETKMVRPNSVAVFHLNPDIAQPYSKRYQDRPEPTKIYKGQAIIVKSDEPIIVYGVSRYLYSSDGYLAIPKSSSGNEYVVSSFGDNSNVPENIKKHWNTSYTAIVGMYDDTYVDFRVGGTNTTWVPVDTYSINNAIRSGHSTYRIINKGDLWLIPAMGEFGDLTGSHIKSTKPVSVYSGNFCANIPKNVNACDFIVEAELPIETWGYNYHVAPIAERKKNSYITLLARENNTTVYKNGIPWQTIIRGKGGNNVQGGYIQMRISDVNDSVSAFTLSSDIDKPISVTQYNTSGMDDDVPTDPFQMVLTPVEQYKNSILYHTPGLNDDYAFENNWVNIIYLAEENGDIPEHIEFGRVVNEELTFEKLKNMSIDTIYKFYTPDREDNRVYSVAQLRLPWGDGLYGINSKEPIASYAYGGSEWDSYGFPTGLSLRNLDLFDTLPPKITFNMDCKGNVPSKAIPNSRAIIRDTAKFELGETTSNLALIYMATSESYNYKFEYDEFIAGMSVQTNFKLTVIDKRLPAKARIVCSDRNGNSSDTIIVYNPPRFLITPSKHDFGVHKIDGATVTQEFTIRNISEFTAKLGKIFFKSSEKDYDISEYKLIDADSESAFKFDFSELNYNTAFSPNETRKFKVSFTPTSVGIFIDSIGIGDENDCLYFYQTEIRASVGNPLISVTDVNFGDVFVNKPAPARHFDINNYGNTPLLITGYTGPKLSVFTCNDLQELQISEQNPLTIQVGETRRFYIDFTPVQLTSYLDSIIFVNNSELDNPNYKPYCKITGRGVEPGLLANSFDWGRQRADIYDAKPQYKPEPYSNNENVIQLVNDGAFDVVLERIEVTENINGNAFLIYKNGTYIPIIEALADFEGITILSGATYEIPLFFLPSNEGEHKLELNYVSDIPVATQSILTGKGIYPVIDGTDVQFSQFTIGSNAKTNQFTLKNIALSEYINNSENLDILNIYDFEILNGPLTFNSNEINNSIAGSPVFYINKDAIEFPILLYPNDPLRNEIKIPVIFHPGYKGEFNAQLKIESDAINEIIININGISITEGLNYVSIEADVCIGSITEFKDEKAAKIFNNSSSTFIIEDIDKTDINIEIAESVLSQLEYELLPGEELIIPFSFSSPAAIQTTNASIIVKTNAVLEEFKEIHIPITIYSKAYTLSSSAFVNKTVLSPGNHLDYKVTLDPVNIDFDMLDISKLVVTLEYERNFMAAHLPAPNEKNAINVLIPGWFVSNVQKSYEQNETTVITLEGPKLTGNDVKDLLSLTFKGYLPSTIQGNELERIYSTEIKHSLETFKSNNQAEICGNVITSNIPEIAYSEVCADELRVIKVSTNKFELETVNPNPVNGTMLEINFSLGMNVYAELNIYNTNGDLILQAVASYLNNGNYSTSISTIGLSTGVYYYELKAGHFNEIKKFVLKK